jgi:predicted RNA-binding Zn-ribbon protein involved in translation (DUF1610 family)
MTSLAWIRRGSTITYEKNVDWPLATPSRGSRVSEIYEIVSVHPRTLRIGYTCQNQTVLVDVSTRAHFCRTSKKRIRPIWIETDNIKNGDSVCIENENCLVQNTEWETTPIGLNNSLKIVDSSSYPHGSYITRWYDVKTGILLKESFQRSFTRQPCLGWGKLQTMSLLIKDANIPELLYQTLRCTSCGNLLDASRKAKYCLFCGTRIEKQNETRIYQSSIRCSKCGSPNGPHAHFCNNCGTRLASI